jgi:glycosyltransferase involved in cell wall biosynthesis
VSKPLELRILHLDTGRSLRGGQQQLLLLARGLRERGHTQLIVCPQDSPLEADARALELPTLTLPLRDPGHARGIRRLRRELRKNRFDVIHAHDGGGQTIAWLASIGINLRRIASRRVTFLPSRKIDYRLKYQYTAHVVIAVSEFVKRIAISAGVDPSKIEVIPDGIELPEEVPGPEARSQTRERWGLSVNHFVVGCLGSFAPEKGLDLAERAFCLAAQKLPRARMILAVQQASRPHRHAHTSGENDNRIVRVGYQRNLVEFFAGLDLFLMPSRSEGLGSSALLAMAHGIPVVATRVGGIPEIVLDGKTGWLVEPESAEALAEAILKAARNPDRLREAGVNGRLHAEKFSGEKMTARTEALYCRLLEKAAA